MTDTDNESQLIFYPEEKIANLIRSRADAQSLLDPFENFCHNDINSDDKIEWLLVLYRLRFLINAWDEPFTQEISEEFKSLTYQVRSCTDSASDTREEDIMNLFVDGIQIACQRRQQALASNSNSAVTNCGHRDCPIPPQT